MRPELLDVLLCPRCGRDSLRLQPRTVNRVTYGHAAIEEVEDGAVDCRCGLTLPIQEYVLSYEALLPAERRNAARHWAELYRLAWNRGIKGNFDLAAPVAPLLWWGILETAPQPAGERPGALTVLAEHPLLRDCRRLLDIGCGPGSSSLFLARRGCDVVAIDPSLELTQRAKGHAITTGTFVEYVCAELGTICFRDETFQAAYALGSLHHLPVLRPRMAEIHRLLKVGGYLAVDDHHRGNLDTAAVALALKRWVEAEVAPGCRGEPPAVMAALEAALAPHKCLSLGATLPEAEWLFRIRYLDTRYIFLEALGMAYYLHRGKSPAAYETSQEIVGLLSRAWRQAFPEWAEQVTFIGEKESSAPSGRAWRAAGNPQRSRLRRLAYLYWRGGSAAIWSRVLARLTGRSRRP